jgi:hypothetical protein
MCLCLDYRDDNALNGFAKEKQKKICQTSRRVYVHQEKGYAERKKIILSTHPRVCLLLEFNVHVQ